MSKGYSTTRVAHLLRVHRSTVWRLIRSHQLDAVQIAPGSPFRIPRASLEPLVRHMQRLQREHD